MSAANPLRGAAAIIGVGTAGCGEAHGYTELELLAEAARAAIADAGLRLSDIDGLATASTSIPMWPLSVAEYLGMHPEYVDTTTVGGSSFVGHIMPAVAALQAGLCKAVLVCYGSTQRTASMNRVALAQARRKLDPMPFEEPYAPVPPVTGYALAAARHMHQYGTTREQLAAVAVSARKWAQRNPEAFMRGPLSIEDVLTARRVSDPLGVRDCCLVTDGAGAFVLTLADRAKNSPKPPVYVLGSALSLSHRQISAMPDVTCTAAAISGAKAYAMAGMKPADIDVVELYDAFTINTLLFLEDLGFCAKGEAGPFVASGAIAPGGQLPVNTNGGGLSCVHPGMYGIFTTIEAVRQLRNEAGDRQVPSASAALVHANGGTLSSQATLILGTQARL